MARKTGSVNHTHQYFRRDDGLWACSGIDNCSHYMPKNMYPAPRGHKSICWRCEKSFQLMPINMEDDKPMCDECLEIIQTIEKNIGVLEKVTGLAAFGAKIPIKSHAPKKSVEKDEIEVINPDEET